jgi:hypothetical protein
MTRATKSFILGILILSLAGCGGGRGDRLPVFGKIIGGEGQNGSLSLVPVDGTDGPSAITEIKNGEFRYTSDTGPSPGPHEAHILLEKKDSPAASETPKFAPIQPNETPLGKQFDVKVTVPDQPPYQVDIPLGGGSSGQYR